MEGRIISKPDLKESMQAQISEGAQVMLDAPWIRKLIQKNPRTLYLLLSAKRLAGELAGTFPDS